MARLKLDKLAIGTMASGHLNLDISEKVSWDEFPEYASELVKICNGTVTDKADAPDTRIWSVSIGTADLRLVYADYPQMVSLESSSSVADHTIRQLHETLSVWHETGSTRTGV